MSRRTAETAISVKLSLDGESPAGTVATGCGFLDHLLAAFAKHAGAGLAVDAQGDQAATGFHHLAEDCGLALGTALRFCLYGRTDVPTGESAPGVRRFGHAIVPMDEALALAAVDLSGRPFCQVKGLGAGMFAGEGGCGEGGCCEGRGGGGAAGANSARAPGDFGAADWIEFCRGLATAGLFTLHLQVQAGSNAHHILEASAKAAGRALGDAWRPASSGGTRPDGAAGIVVAATAAGAAHAVVSGVAANADGTLSPACVAGAAGADGTSTSTKGRVTLEVSPWR